MQGLIKAVELARRDDPRATSEDLGNLVREYLQVAVLKSIYQSKYGRAVSFMGGTCLRFCYDLKRYSEDLDFALDDKRAAYDFAALLGVVKKDLALRNIDASLSISDDKTVQKAFVRIEGVLQTLDLARVPEQKIHIKIEVDTDPADISLGGMESLFVSRHNEVFPILKHDLETLFAGKALAILRRPYRRGRDFYDLIWYMSRGVAANLAYLNAGLNKGTGVTEVGPAEPSGEAEEFADDAALFGRLGNVVAELPPGFVLEDVGRFLEDHSEEEWLSRYAEVFEQLAAGRLK